MPYKSDIGTAHCAPNPHLENSFWGRIYIYGKFIPKLLNRVKENIRANESEVCEGNAGITVPSCSARADGAGAALRCLRTELAGSAPPRPDPARRCWMLDTQGAPLRSHVTTDAVTGAAAVELCCRDVLLLLPGTVGQHPAVTFILLRVANKIYPFSVSCSFIACRTETRKG